jgi:hypothetical protein
LIKSYAYICLLVALCLSAVAVGCGGGESTASESLTKAEFIKTADKICTDADEAQKAELSAYVKQNPKAEASEAGQVKLVAVAGLPAVRTEIEELAELAAPEGEEAEVEAMLKSMEKALEESEADPSSVLDSAGNPFTSVEKQAAKFGFKSCNTPL